MSDELRHAKDRASRAYAEGRLREALQLFSQVVELDPKDLNTRLKIGDLHRRLGRRELAIAAYEPVAQAYAEEGMLLKAIAVCKVILTVDPSHTSTQDRLADLYAKRRGPASSGVGVPVQGAPVAPSSFGRRIPQSATSFVRQADVAPGAAPGAGGGGLNAPVPPRRPPAGIPSAPPTSAGPLPRRPMPPPPDQTWVGKIDLAELSKHRSEESAEGLAPETPVEAAAEAPAPTPRPAPPPAATSGSGLPRIPLFSDLPRAAFIELLVKMKMREVPAGQVIIREGQPGESFFVVARGQVRVTRRNDAGREVLLARLRDGAFFGEMALLHPGPRTATVTAESESQVLEISKTVLDGVISHYPTVATALRNFHQQRLLATCMATHELFQPFNLDDRRRLMEKFKSRNFERGAVLLEEGQPPTGLYILLHGRLVVTKLVDGEEVTLAELQPGAMFGEMSLLANEPTNATVTAVEGSFVLRLSRRNFNEVMMTHPQILELVARVSDQRREANQVLLDMQLSPHGAMLV